MHNVSLLSGNRFELLQHIQLESDLNGKLSAQAKLNFTKCLTYPSCLLISRAISFPFSCLLFSQQLTVLQVKMFHHILLFIQVLLRFFPCSLNTSSSPSALDEVAFSTSRNENQKHAQSFSSKNVMTKIIQAMSQFIPKRLHLQTIRYFVHKPLFILIQSLTPFECKVNFNQLLQSYMSHMYKNFTGKSS